MSLIGRLFGEPDARGSVAALYSAIVAKARDPQWYLSGGVADTIDGRFEMIAALISLVIARLEREGRDGLDTTARLTEAFIDDMDPQLREIGIGDMVVGKHVGRMMGALGGRLGAYRDAAGPEAFAAALVRNLYRGVTPSPEALDFTAGRLRAFSASLEDRTLDDLQAGRMAA